jgi:hypothetical protein
MNRMTLFGYRPGSVRADFNSVAVRLIDKVGSFSRGPIRGCRHIHAWWTLTLGYTSSNRVAGPEIDERLQRGAAVTEPQMSRSVAKPNRIALRLVKPNGSFRLLGNAPPKYSHKGKLL